MSASAQHNSTGKEGAAIDIGEERLAQVYAQALIGTGENARATPALLDELQAFCTEVLDRFPAFDKVLSAGSISAVEKEQLIGRVVGGRASNLFVNFLKVLANHGRLDILRAIHRAATALYDEMQNRVRVDVTTAVPLGEQEARLVTDRLRNLLGKEPILVQKVDAELIGGILIRSGDTLYDGSVKSQLKQLAGQMINRSVHEIQSRRDRFSHPAGN
ncbi:MAG: ATP synthase F1 subunit delta [Planctomycetaceae bacterium]|nr:ATP synthase F1 subunit delta [Planctomycetaceae bacterium]